MRPCINSPVARNLASQLLELTLRSDCSTSTPSIHSVYLDSMGLFSRFKDRKDDSEQSLGSFTVTARVKSAYTASVLPKGGPGRLVK